MLELESDSPNLTDGNQEAWQEHLERDVSVNPHWVWDIDLESMLLQAKEMFRSMKEEEESAVDF